MSQICTLNVPSLAVQTQSAVIDLSFHVVSALTVW